MAWVGRVPTTPAGCARGGGASPARRWRWGKERLYYSEHILIQFLRPGPEREICGEGTPAQVRGVAI